MSTATSETVITEPGVYDAMPDAVYHADPIPGGSLSQTGAKRLLPPSCPAKFKAAEGVAVIKDCFDFGHAAHRKVLGTGQDYAVTQWDDWRKKEAQAERDALRAAGLTPLRAGDGAAIDGMAAALKNHKLAAALLDEHSGLPEQSLFWRDADTSTWLRARVDWLRHKVDGKRMIVPDYKSAHKADAESFSRSAWDHGYYIQAAWFLNAVRALGLDDDPVFVFVVQETEPPYLVNVIQLDANAMRIGQLQARYAIDIYNQCKATDTWPGYGPDVEVIALPAWAERQFEETR